MSRLFSLPACFARRCRRGAALLLLLLALAVLLAPAAACATEVEPLRVGFYADFHPVSYSEGGSPDAPGFNMHRGYEADLLSALEVMEGAGFVFERRAIGEWPDIWLAPAGAEFDIVGGGITIREDRTRDAAGNTVVAFTNGHIDFRQSLLVRSVDASRLSSHDRLTSEARVGVLAATTGEARLLQLTGLADGDGVLAAGVRIVTGDGAVTADGSDRYYITAAGSAPELEGRRMLYPADDTMPQVVYPGEEAELLAALRDGEVDAIARGEIGNADAAHHSDGDFVVTALDQEEVEHGGFAVGADDVELLKRLNRHLNWLTNNQRIGYSEWVSDPTVFRQRAELWEN